jgi:hypothetical protein
MGWDGTYHFIFEEVLLHERERFHRFDHFGRARLDIGGREACAGFEYANGADAVCADGHRLFYAFAGG